MKKFKRLQVNPLQALVRATLLTGCLSVANVALAENNALPYMPGFTVMGLTGDFTTGYADIMVPLFGQPTSFFYLDPQGLIQNENYTASLGAGFRHLSESAGILGAYVFGDYNQSSNGNGFWFVSPGVERLGKTVDFGANLYIPTSTQSKDVSSTTGLEMGTYDYITFQEHSEFDGLFTTFESVGMGADAEVGVLIPMKNNPKLYVGGYYFSPEDANDNITGVTARLEVPLTNQLTFLVSDGYDNVENNTFKLGLSYNFGGRKNSKTFKGDLTERMVDPIHRNLIAVSGGSKTGEPIVQTVDQSKVLVRDDIAFFNVAESVDGDGTYENPFNEMDQANVDVALNGGNNNFYVNSGTYEVGQDIILTDTNVYGRQSYNGNPFVQSAVGDNRPLFDFNLAGATDSAFELMGSQNLFDSVRLQGGNGAPGNGFGIVVDNADDATLIIKNSEVRYFGTGIVISNTGNFDLQITDSSIHNNDFDGMFFDNFVSGAGGDAKIKILRSSFNDNVNNNGIQLQNGSENLDVTLIDSSFDNNGAVGMSLVNEGGHAEVTAIGSSFDGNVDLGIELINPTSSRMDISLINSSLNDQVNGRGVQFQNDGIAEFSALNSSFSQNGEGGIFTNSATGDITVEFSGSNVDQNAFNGITFSNIGKAEVLVENSSFNLNGFNGMTFTNIATGNFDLAIMDSNFDQNGARGISFANRGTATIGVTGSSFDQNALTGMLVQSVTTAVSTDINIANSTFNQNVNGLAVTNSAANAQINVDVVDSIFDQNHFGILLQNMGMHSTFITTATDSAFTNNTAFGVEGTNTQPTTTMDITLIHPVFAGNAADDNDPSPNVNWTIVP